MEIKGSKLESKSWNMESNIRQTPWLLERNQLLLLAAILPPIALIVVRFNKHKLTKKTVENIQFFASLMM